MENVENKNEALQSKNFIFVPAFQNSLIGLSLLHGCF